MLVVVNKLLEDKRKIVSKNKIGIFVKSWTA